MLYAIQGQTIRLEAIFYDSRGFLSDLETPLVSIYPYGKPPLVVNESMAMESGTPLRIGLGIYTYDFVIPRDAQVGIWYSLWQGTIDIGSILSIVEFEVRADPSGSFPGTRD